MVKEILKQTAVEWKEFTPEQKAAAVVTNALTLARPVLAVTVATRGIDKERKWTSGDAIQMGAAYVTDMEGSIARAMDAKTSVGTAADAFADKVAALAPEIVLALRGEESFVNVAAKGVRDIAISALRAHVSERTNGEVSIGANWTGKANTLFRQAVNTFAVSPLGERMPKTRKTAQAMSAIGTLASGLYTGYKLVRSLKEYESKTASREAASREV